MSHKYTCLAAAPKGRFHRPVHQAMDRWPLYHIFPALILALSAHVTLAGSLRATLQTNAAITAAYAIERQFTPTGVTSAKPIQGKIEGDQLIIEGLAPGQYFLRFETPDGVIEGWDAGVPPSDYVEEQPLSEESIQAILDKLRDRFATGYDDQVVVLDVQGNIQNAAILMTQLRTRSFVTGAGRVEGEWTWRVSRWQYENPDEATWVPYQERPYYALARRRLRPETYRELAVVYARHLGHILITEDRPEVDLGIIAVPKAKPGIHAANPDGTFVTPIQIKPEPKE